MITELAIAFVSAFISWLVTDFYSRKSLENQKTVFESIIEPLKAEIYKLSANNNTQAVYNNSLLLKDERIKDASLEYRKKGSPRFIIDTYSDLDNDQKAELYDTVLLLERGRKGKNNPYRGS